MSELANYQAYQDQINTFLASQLDKLETNDEKLLEAMRYGLLIGGKRMRPYLAYTTGESLGAAKADIDANKILYTKNVREFKAYNKFKHS